MAALFEIAREYLDLAEAIAQIDEAPEEFQSELEALFAQMAETTGRELAEKVDGYAGLIGKLQASADFRKNEAKVYQAEADRLKALAETDLAAVERLKARLKTFFEVTGLKKVEGDRYRVSLAGNGGRPPLIVEDVPVSEIPAQYQVVNWSLDRDAVRAALEAGTELNFARLGDRGSHIRIK